jgi:hypothetical protein
MSVFPQSIQNVTITAMIKRTTLEPIDDEAKRIHNEI